MGPSETLGWVGFLVADITLATWISLANFVLLCVAFVLGLWIKDRFFTPLKLGLLEATSSLTAAITAVDAQRKVDYATMQGLIATQAATLGAIVDTVRSLKGSAEKITSDFGESALNLAREQGRLATAEHHIRGEIAAVKIKQDVRIRREQEPWDGVDRRGSR